MNISDLLNPESSGSNNNNGGGSQPPHNNNGGGSEPPHNNNGGGGSEPPHNNNNGGTIANESPFESGLRQVQNQNTLGHRGRDIYSPLHNENTINREQHIALRD